MKRLGTHDEIEHLIIERKEGVCHDICDSVGVVDVEPCYDRVRKKIVVGSRPAEDVENIVPACVESKESTLQVTYQMVKMQIIRLCRRRMTAGTANDLEWLGRHGI